MASQATRWCLAFIFIASEFGLGQTSSQEEAVVRGIYAKLAYTAQTSAVIDAVQKDPKIDGDTLRRKVTEQEVHFAIQDVTVGKTQNTGGKSYDDYVTKPETGGALDRGLTNTSVQAEGTSEVHQVGVRPK